MSSILPIQIKAIVPTTNGSALFLEQESKVFALYLDKEIGETIQRVLNEEVSERPLSHNLMIHILDGLGAEVERVIINAVNKGTFYARLIVSMENELGHKIIELDARPSDSIALSLLSNKPIYVSKTVLDAVEDMSEILDKILESKS
jgi:bifunctional DNase/RNase